MSTPEQLMVEIRQLLQQGRYKDAAAACREALGEAPDNAELRMLMGLCEEAAGRPDHGRAWMEKALDKQPEHAAAAFHLGRLLLIEGRDEDAEQTLGRCIEADPNHAAARTLLARIHQRAGRREAAIDGLRTALLADQDHAPAHAGLAVLLMRLGSLDQAHQHAAAALRLRPEDALSQITMAQIMQAQGHDDFAEQCLRNAIEARPDHAELRAALDQLQRVRGPQSGSGQTDTLERQLERMRVHYRQGQLRPAAELADAMQFRFTAADPVMLELAEVLMDAGQLETAADILERSDAGLPRHALTAARLSAMRGDLAAAQRRLADLFADESAEIRHDARRLSADLHLRGQRLDQALEALRPLAEEAAAPPASLRMLAQLEHAGGETARARDLISVLLERDGLNAAEQAVSHNLLGRMLDESGAYQAAARHLIQGAWRQPLMVDELDQLSPAALSQAWTRLEAWTFPGAPVDDGRQTPLFVSGWPGSGREALLPALLSTQQLGLLPPEELMRRRDILQLPADPQVLARLSESELLVARKRYLRGAPQGANGLLEPGQMEVTALPAVARLFPGATLIWLRATEAGLKLHWHLAGCREVQRMVEVWRREQELFAHLVTLLPLKIVEMELDALIASDPETIQRLAEASTAKNPQTLADTLKNAFAQAGYRPADHWRHYDGLL